MFLTRLRLSLGIPIFLCWSNVCGFRSSKGSFVTRGQGNAEVVILYAIVRNLTHRFHGVPFAGINRILGTCNRGIAINSPEGDVHKVAFDNPSHTGDLRRSGIDFEAWALLGIGESLLGR